MKSIHERWPLRNRFAMLRKHTITPKWLTNFYGSYRASIYYRNSVQRGLFRFGKYWYKIPHWIMPIFAPFNTYTHSMKGVSHMKGHHDDGQAR